jgi:hypothetical protein
MPSIITGKPHEDGGAAESTGTGRAGRILSKGTSGAERRSAEQQTGQAISRRWVTSTIRGPLPPAMKRPNRFLGIGVRKSKFSCKVYCAVK